MNQPTVSQQDNRPTSASALLVTAALTGLFGVMPMGCSDDAKPASDSSGTTGGTGGKSSGSEAGAGGTGATPDTYNDLVDGEAADVTMDDFRTLCDERGGYVYVNAVCAGSSMCKGLSLHDGEIWNHSCRGQNSTCSGVGCLDMPEDKGQSGKEIYETGNCGTCHADWSKTVDYDNPVIDYSRFAVFYDPKVTTGPEAKDLFKTGPVKRLEAITVWGTQGRYDEYDFTPYSNMPTYYQKYSLAEIRRVVEYVRTLCPFTSPYGVFGQEGPPEDLAEDRDAACPK